MEPGVQHRVALIDRAQRFRALFISKPQPPIRTTAEYRRPRTGRTRGVRGGFVQQGITTLAYICAASGDSGGQDVYRVALAAWRGELLAPPNHWPRPQAGGLSLASHAALAVAS